MRTTAATAVLITAGLLTITACEGSGTASKPPAPTREDGAKPSTPAPGTGGTETAQLPDFVGMGLQSAQDSAQDAGFHSLTSHDALGRGRNQAFDRNWKVCSQTPKPGNRPSDSRVDFGTVKLEETCPKS